VHGLQIKVLFTSPNEKSKFEPEKELNVMSEKNTKYNDLFIAISPDEASRSIIFELVNALPNIVAILDGERRLVFSNKAILESVNAEEIDELFQLRPGELFKCINSTLSDEGCGASEACQLCGALRAMDESRLKGDKVTKDFTILSRNNGMVNSHHFNFTSTPFLSNGEFYYIISLINTDGEFRKRELERIFFHDIMNSISSLSGVISLIKAKNSADPVYLNILDAIHDSLFDSINEQKQVVLAEKGELLVNLQHVSATAIIEKAILHFKNSGKYAADLQIRKDSVDRDILTDEALLVRILINMLKNALEASNINERVTIGSELQGDSIRFSIHNPGFIPHKAQLLIFERSFSTKGSGRGLGTFSMKLLGENYLKGKVNFASTESEGTRFWIDIPLNKS